MRTFAGEGLGDLSRLRDGRRPARSHHGRSLVVLTILSAYLPTLSYAEPPPAPLIDGGAATVAEVIDGDTVRLHDGRQVRLVGMQAPKLPLGRPGFVEWPLAGAAQATLAGLIGGAEVRLGYGGQQTDSHGRVLAHLFRSDGLWVQGEMLGRGMARVYTFSDNRSLIPELLAREREARAERAGIWSHPFYQVVRADDAADHVGGFAVVEGRVQAADVVRGRGYLNFSADWRTDFTVSIAPEDRRRFEDDGIDIAS